MTYYIISLMNVSPFSRFNGNVGKCHVCIYYLKLALFFTIFLPGNLWADVDSPGIEQFLPSLNPKYKISQFVFKRWTMEDNLPSNSIRTITQTSDGYLWIGTNNGLVRFDGVKFQTFNSENTSQFKYNQVNALLAGKDGELWIGTNSDGLLYYKQGKFKKYTSQNGLASNRIYSLIFNLRGQLLIGAESGVNVFNNEKFTYLHKGKQVTQVSALHLDGDGTVWIGSNVDGLFSFRDNGDNVLNSHAGIFNFATGAIREICADKDGNVLIATPLKGLFRFKNGKFVNVRKLGNQEVLLITKLYIDRAGSFWIGTHAGIGRFSNGNYERFQDLNLLGDTRITAIFEDREGNLWVGSYLGGLCRITEGYAVSITKKEKLTGNAVRSVYEDRKGNIWLGYNQIGISRLDNEGIITTYGIKHGLPDDSVRCFFEDSFGILWIGTRKGIACLKDGIFKTIYKSPKVPRNIVHCFHEPLNEPGIIMAGMENNCIIRIKDDSITPVFANSPLMDKRCRWIIESPDRPGIYWLGTSAGLVRLEGNNSMLISGGKELPVKEMISVYQDSGGALWFGTNGGGIGIYKNGKFKTYTTSDGLLDNYIWSIIEDDNGNIWMSCDNGIFRIKKQDFPDYDRGKISRLTPVVYGQSDGMKSTECNSSGNPVLKRAGDGTLWYPTMMGVVIIDPNNIKRSILPPPVYIEEVKIDGHGFLRGPETVVRAASKDFIFNYTALNYYNPLGIRFKYKLEGYNNDWVDAGTRRSAYFTNLPSGNYRFKVIASNSEGLWNTKGAELVFILPPKFYETWWFFILAGLFISFTVYVLFSRRMRGIRLRNLQLLKEIRERKYAQKEMVHLRNLLKNMIDFMPSILIGVDKRGRVTHWNLEAQNKTGISEDEALGRDLEHVLPSFGGEFTKIPDVAKAGQSIKNHRIVIREKNGSRYFDLTIYPLTNHNGTGTVVRIDDVTESQIKDHQLRQAQKLESIGNLAGGMAHDFNNYLTGILGTLSLADHRLNRNGQIDKEQWQELYPMITQCGHRATNMVKQLMSFSREQPLEFKQVDLNRTIKHVIKICENSLHKSVILFPEYSEKQALVTADPSQIEQVLLNLCINADHAMTIMRGSKSEWGGRLTVSLKLVPASEDLLQKYTDAAEINYWELSVQDEGIGMDSETAAKIFTPFFTRKAKHSGTGLGLSMVYNIVKQHKGFVDFHSQPGKGTTFYLYFPVLHAEIVIESKITTEAGIQKGEGLILVVDDEKIMRDLAGKFLSECGYEVIMAKNGRECVQLYQQRKDDIKAVLLDMSMPEMSGREAYIRMKVIDPYVKVLLVSGSRKDNRIDDVLKLGVDGFTQKPFTLSKLSFAIHKIIYGNNNS